MPNVRFLNTLLLCAFVSIGSTAQAQNAVALARIDSDDSYVSDRLLGGVDAKLTLSQPVPYRVFTLDDTRTTGF